IASLVVVVSLWAGIFFQRCALGMKNWKQVFVRSGDLGPPTRPISPRLRIVFGLIGVAALGFMVLYLAKIIQVSVWDSPQRWYLWFMAYSGFTLSLSLMYRLARDYQKFVYGMPSMTLSADK